jgi:hypothetical protein
MLLVGFCFHTEGHPANLPPLMKASTLVRMLVWVSFASAFTGTAPAASNNVEVTVESVSDMRATGNSSPRCSVQLRFSGGDASDAYNIHDVRVTTAVDDTGHDLRAEPNPERERMRFPQAYYGPQGNPFAQQSMHPVELLSPPREARSIKLLEGEAELFFPTTENGGLVIIKNILAHAGETFTNPALKKLNVNITYFGNGDEANTSTQRVQATISNRTAQATPPTPGDAVTGVRRLPFHRFPQSRGLQFSIDDPDHRLVDMIFMDAYYRQAWGGMSSMGPNTRTYQFQSELPSSLRLYIYLAAPDAIKTVPFKIENIELP